MFFLDKSSWQFLLIQDKIPQELKCDVSGSITVAQDCIAVWVEKESLCSMSSAVTAKTLRGNQVTLSEWMSSTNCFALGIRQQFSFRCDTPSCSLRCSHETSSLSGMWWLFLSKHQTTQPLQHTHWPLLLGGSTPSWGWTGLSQGHSPMTFSSVRRGNNTPLLWCQSGRGLEDEAMTRET